MEITKELEEKVIKFYLAPNTIRDTAWYILGQKCTKNVDIILKKYNIPKHSVETINKIMEQKYLQKYGVTNPSASAQVKEKRKQVIIKKYGVENVFQVNEVKQKIKSTCLKKYGVDHYNKTDEGKQRHKNTCLKKYGVSSPLQLDEFKEKSKQSCLAKYGKDSYKKTAECKEKIRLKQALITKKQLDTKRKNHTFNCSTSEKKYFKILQNIFGLQNVLAQYKEARYPYLCDLYIKSKDLFIELNFLWTHGGKLFTGSQEDLAKLAIWEQKAISSKYYKNAIETWTHRDVQKNNTAKLNHLNYLVFYTQADIDNWLKNYKGD